MSKLNSPILIIAYNRYGNFKTLLNSLKFYKTKIYISIDGPKNNYDEVEQRKIVNLIIKIKKTYKIKYRVLKQNYGCQKAVFSALDWFFLHEKKGIILEDDTLPSPSFFNFCNKLLIKYYNDKKIFSISGYTPLKKTRADADYFFSKFFMCWGWATWRSRWLIAKKLIPKKKWTKALRSKEVELFLNDNIKKQYFKKVYKLILSNKLDSWAFLWLLFSIVNRSKFILPKYNLIQNTGTQTYGANYVPSKFDYANFKTTKFKIKHHPQINSYDEKLDSLLFYHNFRPKNLLYPWRIIFLVRSLLFDTKFFFTKLALLVKK
tara:strand:+ start:345 stop:1301 length:957 start_codon:yes stop_codon:yes gene_type:complete